MATESIQNLRQKFEKRTQQLQSVGFDGFHDVLSGFLDFFNDEPVLNSIGNDLRHKYPASGGKVIHLFQSRIKIEFGGEEERCAIALEMLRRIVADEIPRRGLMNSIYPTEFSTHDYGNRQYEVDEKYLDTFRAKYLDQFCRYIEERLESIEFEPNEQDKILEILVRYKHRSEWFYDDVLLAKYTSETNDATRQAEKVLARDLYAYLFDQGIDFFIEPSSNRGAIDLISLQPDPRKCLLAEVKIFDG